jgi:hypothetical protein
MSIKQTVVFNNNGDVVGNPEEALISINAGIVDSAQREELESRRLAGEFTPSLSFNLEEQTITIERIWADEVSFNSYKANWPGEGDNKVSLEQSGWVCLPEVVETI